MINNYSFSIILTADNDDITKCTGIACHLSRHLSRKISSPWREKRKLMVVYTKKYVEDDDVVDSIFFTGSRI